MPCRSGRDSVSAGPSRRAALAGLAAALACSDVAGADSALVDVGGAFNLISHEGRRVGSRELLGRPYAIFFGFTHCPDVCPTALFELGLVLKDLGDAADALAPLFVTVDPARDTQEQLALYLSSFDPRIIGLTGTEDEILVAMRAFKVVARKVPLAAGDYTMEHTALMFLMDRRGRFFDKLDYRDEHAKQVAALRRLLALG
ncbi:SCO family protein [Bosea sp. RCC_152_1]|uniref:SCO family protein n=1 Tax=Bosea sp. RCC_152_1 TaxID=3239228 RepID=UPI003525E3FA